MSFRESGGNMVSRAVNCGTVSIGERKVDVSSALLLERPRKNWFR